MRRWNTFSVLARKPIPVAGVAVRRGLVLLCLPLLAACAGSRGAGMAVAHYDLGPPRPVATAGFPLRTVEVQGASWLGTPAMQYRLRYADGARREAYAQSRWVAPPAQLLEAALQRDLLGAPAAGGCRLRVELDEFIQTFDSERDSQAVIEARFVLKTLRSDAPLARHAVRLEKPAASADARGGALAFTGLAAELGQAATSWLRQRAAEDAALVQRCSAG